MVRPTRVEQALVALLVLAVIAGVTWLINQETAGGATRDHVDRGQELIRSLK